jgi:heme-degrading monooxygenase HmoA
MYVRITTLTGATNVAAAVDHIETKARPAVEGMAGHRGLAVLTDEAAGTVAVAAYWDTAEQLESAAGTVSKMRETIRDVAGGGEMRVEVYEAAVTKRYAMPPAGAIARFLRVESDPAEADAAVAFWSEKALPATARAAGIVSAQLLLDRATGKGISVTGWKSQADLDAALPALTALREQVADAVPSANVVGVEQLTLVSTTAQLGG